MTSPESKTNDEDFLNQINLLEEELRLVQQPIIQRLQQLLHEYEGYKFLQENKRKFAALLQDLLMRLDKRVTCPKTQLPGCLRVSRMGNFCQDSFQIQVKESDKRTSHFSSVSFPRIDLCDAPADARRKNYKEEDKR